MARPSQALQLKRRAQTFKHGDAELQLMLLVREFRTVEMLTSFFGRLQAVHSVRQFRLADVAAGTVEVLGSWPSHLRRRVPVAFPARLQRRDVLHFTRGCGALPRGWGADFPVASHCKLTTVGAAMLAEGFERNWRARLHPVQANTSAW